MSACAGWVCGRCPPSHPISQRLWNGRGGSVRRRCICWFCSECEQSLVDVGQRCFVGLSACPAPPTGKLERDAVSGGVSEGTKGVVVEGWMNLRKTWSVLEKVWHTRTRCTNQWSMPLVLCGQFPLSRRVHCIHHQRRQHLPSKRISHCHQLTVMTWEKKHNAYMYTRLTWGWWCVTALRAFVGLRTSRRARHAHELMGGAMKGEGNI